MKLSCTDNALDNEFTYNLSTNIFRLAWKLGQVRSLQTSRRVQALKIRTVHRLQFHWGNLLPLHHRRPHHPPPLHSCSYIFQSNPVCNHLLRCPRCRIDRTNLRSADKLVCTFGPQPRMGRTLVGADSEQISIYLSHMILRYFPATKLVWMKSCSTNEARNIHDSKHSHCCRC